MTNGLYMQRTLGGKTKLHVDEPYHSPHPQSRGDCRSCGLMQPVPAAAADSHRSPAQNHVSEAESGMRLLERLPPRRMDSAAKDRDPYRQSCGRWDCAVSEARGADGLRRP